MNTSFQSLDSIDWWFGVVVVGIAINLVSAYIKGPCDRVLSGASMWWATRSEAQRKARAERIARLRASKDEQTFALIQALHIRVRSILMVLTAFFMLIAAAVLRKEPATEDMVMVRFILKLLSLLPMMLGLHDSVDVIRRNMEIHEARKPAA